MEPPSPISPLTILSPRALAARLRELSGQDRAPIGERTIRRAIRRGELRAARIGNRDLIQWSDYLVWYASFVREPVTLPPDRAARIEADVIATIRRERTRARRLATGAGRGTRRTGV